MTALAEGQYPGLKFEIDLDAGFVILENRRLWIRWARRDYEDGYRETVIRDFVDKSTGDNHAGHDDLDMSWYGEAEGRGPLTNAYAMHEAPDRLSLRLEWNGGKGVQEVSIFPDSPYVKLDYVRYGVNIVDIGDPGYSRMHWFYGAADWIRRYVDYPESYYNRYPGDGIDDSADGGSLNYRGSFIMGLYNEQTGRGYGRVMPMMATPIIKLLPWKGRGFEVFPYFGETKRPFTGYLYAVTSGEAELGALGRHLADRERKAS